MRWSLPKGVGVVLVIVTATAIPVLALDVDRDGLQSYEELFGYSSAFDADSDDDGLCDGGGGSACIDPVTGISAGGGEDDFGGSRHYADSDSDGLSDLVEARAYARFVDRANQSPLYSSDFDADQIPDADEARNGTDAYANDTDGDGADDGEELLGRWKTDPLLNDTDGDGLPDGVELHESYTDPTDPDSDFDELLDGDEQRLGTNPWSEDSDRDRMPDGWEVRFGLDPLRHDGSEDLDEDRALSDGPGLPANNANLTNLQEWLIGTDPSDPDTDDDGMDDVWEYLHGLNATRADAGEDADGDGLSNAGERRFFLHPRENDTDGDGLGDGLEIIALPNGSLLELSNASAWDTDDDIFDDPDELAFWLGVQGITSLKAASPAQLAEIAIAMHSPDADQDGIVDGDEVGALGTDPGNNDTDGDGLLDLAELRCAADPHNIDKCNSTSGDRSDSDGDGVSDAIERAFWGSDRASRDADGDGKLPLFDADSDGDGIGDGEEIGALGLVWAEFYHTSPARNDTDADGLLDAEEDTNKLTIFPARCAADAPLSPDPVEWQETWAFDSGSRCWYVVGAWGIRLYVEAPSER